MKNLGVHDSIQQPSNYRSEVLPAELTSHRAFSPDSNVIDTFLYSPLTDSHLIHSDFQLPDTEEINHHRKIGHVEIVLKMLPKYYTGVNTLGWIQFGVNDAKS